MPRRARITAGAYSNFSAFKHGLSHYFYRKEDGQWNPDNAISFGKITSKDVYHDIMRVWRALLTDILPHDKGVLEVSTQATLETLPRGERPAPARTPLPQLHQPHLSPRDLSSSPLPPPLRRAQVFTRYFEWWTWAKRHVHTDATLAHLDTLCEAMFDSVRSEFDSHFANRIKFHLHMHVKLFIQLHSETRTFEQGPCLPASCGNASHSMPTLIGRCACLPRRRAG